MTITETRPAALTEPPPFPTAPPVPVPLHERSDRARAALATLAALSTDEIANLFRAERIRGVRRSDRCPVAVYLTRMAGGGGALAGTTRVAYFPTPYVAMAGIDGIVMATPDSVGAFIASFDHFRYPELMLASAEPANMYTTFKAINFLAVES